METFVCEYDTYNKHWLDINGINTIIIIYKDIFMAKKLNIKRIILDDCNNGIEHLIYWNMIQCNVIKYNIINR